MCAMCPAPSTVCTVALPSSEPELLAGMTLSSAPQTATVLPPKDACWAVTSTADFSPSRSAATIKASAASTPSRRLYFSRSSMSCRLTCDWSANSCCRLRLELATRLRLREPPDVARIDVRTVADRRDERERGDLAQGRGIGCREGGDRPARRMPDQVHPRQPQLVQESDEARRKRGHRSVADVLR